MNFGIQAHAQQNTVNAEKKQAFEKTMNSFITEELDAKTTEIKSNPDSFENFDEYTAEDFESIARENLKNEYIHHHMKEYLNTYFSDPQAMVNTDTFICDNGGFEANFLYYKGYKAHYNKGSDDCIPQYNNGDDVVFTPAVLPTSRRFEIVTSGLDQLTGIKKVKFGNKALRINNKLGHSGSSCTWKNKGVDKIVKRFKVTEETRDFTVWYSVALENPGGHNNAQPFLNIKCDLDPDNELCFDANILKCPNYYNDPCVRDSVDVLDWACHRFKIPEDYVDSIATLEITVGDCGLGAHFGYAYIDGICEECDSSSLGSAILEDIDKCDTLIDNTDTLTICGFYTLPIICSNGGDWKLEQLTIPEYEIYNLTIDTMNHTFCFDFPKSNLGNEDCVEVYAELLFSNDSTSLPIVFSNNIEICKNNFIHYNINVLISDCSDNNTPDILSDDYYFVNIGLTNTGGDYWEITKQLVDPYPNESGLQTLGTGTGDAYLKYGPFYKQEGDWWLTIDIGDCQYVEYIEAPGYCSACDKFNDVEIQNIECDINAQDEYIWTFDIEVPCDGHLWDFTILDASDLTYNVSNPNCGQPVQFEGSISDGCQKITLFQQNCNQPIILTVCPPKPCPKEGNCDLEVYVKDVTCLEPQNGIQPYEVELDITGTNNKHVCVFWNDISIGYIYPYLTIPLDMDVDLKIALCDDVQCTQNCDECYKWIHLNKPNCNDPRFGGKKGKGGSPGKEEANTIDFGSLMSILGIGGNFVGIGTGMLR